MISVVEHFTMLVIGFLYSVTGTLNIHDLWLMEVPLPILDQVNALFGFRRYAP
ncbi:MAG: hypothetical protein WAV32_08000 [Halobacteriota archaeon]